MLLRRFAFCYFILCVTTTLGSAQSPSPNGVRTLNPRGAISTGNDTWSVGARAGDFIFVAGMQGAAQEPLKSTLLCLYAPLYRMDTQ